MRKIQISAFISVLPGAELGGIPDVEVAVCTSAYAEGAALDSVMGEVEQNLRDAVRDARTGNAPATPCGGPRPRMCPMGLRQMRVRDGREEMGEFAYRFLSRALARFEKRIDIDWRAVSHMDAEALGVPDWLIEGIRYECAKDIGTLPIFAALLDGFTRNRIAPFFYGLTPSRPLVLRLLAKAYLADMLDALPLLDHGSGSDSLDDWCFHQDCPCGIAHVFDDAGHTHYLCPQNPDF